MCVCVCVCVFVCVCDNNNVCVQYAVVWMQSYRDAVQRYAYVPY